MLKYIFLIFIIFTSLLLASNTGYKVEKVSCENDIIFKIKYYYNDNISIIRGECINNYLIINIFINSNKCPSNAKIIFNNHSLLIPINKLNETNSSCIVKISTKGISLLRASPGLSYKILINNKIIEINSQLLFKTTSSSNIGNKNERPSLLPTEEEPLKHNRIMKENKQRLPMILFIISLSVLTALAAVKEYG